MFGKSNVYVIDKELNKWLNYEQRDEYLGIVNVILIDNKYLYTIQNETKYKKGGCYI